MSGPSLAELKAAGQPPSVIDRLNDEHWAGRLYMRRISPHATWVFARLGWSPNAVTLAFIACGIAAGVVIAFGGLATAIAAALLIQLYLLFDCSDGELARPRGHGPIRPNHRRPRPRSRAAHPRPPDTRFNNPTASSTPHKPSSF